MTPKSYLDALPADRRKILESIRKVLKRRMPKGFKEAVNWGMIVYEVPLAKFPDTYNGQPLAYVALASQKNHLTIYLPCIGSAPAAEKKFLKAYKASGKKLDMGKSCLRFKSLNDLDLDAIGDLVASGSVESLIAQHEKSHAKKRPRAKT